MDGFERIMCTILIFLVVVVCVLLFVVIPRVLYIDAYCLKAGYPKSSMAWDLTGYCITLEGGVASPAVPLERATRK